MRSVSLPSKTSSVIRAKVLFQFTLSCFLGALALSILTVTPAMAAPPIEGVPCILGDPAIPGSVWPNSPSNLQCTASDINLSSPVVTVFKGCDFPGDTAQLQVFVDVTGTAQTRYDIGVWLSVDGDPNGDGSETGVCSVMSIPLLDGLGDPVLDVDGISVDINSNQCGDVANTVLGPPDIINVDMGIVDLLCIDTDGDGQINVPLIISWAQGANTNNCQVSTDALPGAPSKCRANNDVNIDVPVPGQIIVSKTTIPFDAQSFAFNLSGPALDPVPALGFDGDHGFPLASGEIFDTALFAGGLTPGVYSLTETPDADYVSSFVCNSNVDGAVADPTAIDLQAGETVTCDVTNTLKGTVAIVKRTIGAPLALDAPVEEFDFLFDATPFTLTPLDDGTGNGFDSVDNSGLAPGVYVFTEIPETGWELTDISCVGGDTTEDLGAGTATITVVADETVTCTFENTEYGSIIVDKVTEPSADAQVFDFVTNYGGGGFSLADASTPNNSGPLLPSSTEGNYSVTEDTVSGWEQTSAICTGDIGGSKDPADLILLAGETINCTFTNTRQVELTLRKEWLGGVSGDTATLIVAGVKGSANNNSVSGGGDEIDIVNTATLTTVGGETVTLGELLLLANVGDYTANFSCDGINAPTYVLGDLSATLLIDPSDAPITCTFTNTVETGTLTLIKSVDNGDGGLALPDDFLLTVDGSGVTSGAPNVYTANIPVAINETLLPGYAFVSITGDAKCPADLGGTVTLAAGDDITCTIANDDVAPQLTLVKTVDNADGGLAIPDDFLLTVGGAPVLSGASNAYMANTPLAIDETLLTGYSFVSITGDAKCPAALGGTVTLDVGDNITCTIANDDVAPQLTLVKTVDNADGGLALPDDFMLTVGGAPVLSGASNAYAANTPLAINETLLPGYAFVSITGDAKCPAALGGTVTLAPGDDITCTIANDDVAPQLTLVKTVDNADGGLAIPDDFLLTVGGAGVTSGASNAYMANTPLAINETLLTGYTFVSITGDAKCPAALGGTVTLDVGDNITCTIANDDVAPQLTLVKTVDNADGGLAIPDDFMLTVGGAPVLSGASNAYAANTPLAIDETLLPGYAFVSITGDAKCPAVLGGTVTLAPGDDITCTIANDDVAPQLTLVKTVDNADGGLALPDDFMLTVGGAPVLSGASNPYMANTPLAIDETLLTGYVFVSITGDAKCPAALGGTVTLDVGDNITCTIANDDVGPQLTLVKTVDNADGGLALPDDFLLTVGGVPVLSGASNAYSANTPLAIDETLLTGYEFVSITGDAKCPAALGGTVTLAPGDDITCTIANDDVAPLLTLVKDVINDDFGTAVPDDFLLTVDGAGVSSGASNAYMANTPLAIDETLLPGYSFVSITGDVKCPAALGGTVTLDVGDDITCTITNDDVAPVINLAKTVNGPAVRQAGGTYVVEYTITATNAGGPGVYSLIDAFTPGVGITLDSATAVYLAGTEDSQTGTTGAYPNFVTDEELAKDLDESWIVTATFSIDLALVTAEGNDCDETNAGLENTGFANGVTGSDSEVDFTDNRACTEFTPPAISLVKTADVATYSFVGDFINYDYLITNLGPDTLDPGLASVVDDQETVTCPAAVVLMVGDTVTCTASHEVTQEDLDAGLLTNIATAMVDDVTSNEDTVTVVAVLIIPPPMNTVPVPALDLRGLLALIMLMLATGWYFRSAMVRRF